MEQVTARNTAGHDAAQDAARHGGLEISNLIRRVRRLARLSQRELAERLDVSQSAVAKWETGRTVPSARLLAQALAVAELSLVAVRADGRHVRPMRTEAARDAAERRYPAHTFVWAEGWWVPDGAATTAWYGQILRRSADIELPKVRYSRRWQLGRPPTPADVNDHPTWRELVAEAKEGWQPRRHRPVSIPQWAVQDSSKSRNRSPASFRVV